MYMKLEGLNYSNCTNLSPLVVSLDKAPAKLTVRGAVNCVGASQVESANAITDPGAYSPKFIMGLLIALEGSVGARGFQP